MRLISKAFLFITASVGTAGSAWAQPEGYEPPPVEYADAGEPVRAQPSRVAPPEEQGPQPAVRVARTRTTQSTSAASSRFRLASAPSLPAATACLAMTRPYLHERRSRR
jgi:hypothetical protein